jgi:HAMP domain-containing protein
MFISVCLLAFGVGGYLVSGTARAALESEILARLDFQSRAYATALEGRLQTLARRTEDFASDGYIRDFTEGLLNEGEVMRAKQLRDELRAHLVENKLPLEPSFVDLCLVAADGEVLLSTRDDYAATLPEAITSRPLDAPSYFSDFVRSDSDGSTRLFISTPVYSRRGGRCLGRLVSWVHPGIWIVSAMRGSGLATGAGGDPVRLQLVDAARSHLIIDPQLTTDEGPAVDSELMGSSFGLELVSEGEAQGLAQRVRREGYELFTKAYPIGSSGWSVQVDLIPYNAFAPVGGLQNRFLGVGLVLALAASALLFFPMRFLARPLARLSEAARRMGDGDYLSRVEIDSSDELGELGESFNSMADAVQERTERLQHTAEDLRDRQSELGFERDRLRAVISSMRDGLVVLDSEGVPVIHNTAAEPLLQQILEMDRELHSHHFCERRESGDAECRRCLFDPIAVPRSCMLEIGSSVYEVHATRLASGQNGRSGRVLVSRDLSDRIEQDERQIHQERLAVLGEVAAVMAHELNNPLAAINMYNQMTADEVAAD